MATDLPPVELGYTILGLPLPVSSWNLDDPRSHPSEARAVLSKFLLSKKVFICHPVADKHAKVAPNMLRSIKDRSLHFKNVNVSLLCCVPFIRRFLTPHKLRFMSTGTTLSEGPMFSLSYDEGLYLQITTDCYNSLGLANTESLHRHKDGYITLRMDVTSKAYLKEGSKLYRKTMAALKKLPLTNCIASSTCEFDGRPMEKLLKEIGNPECQVQLLRQEVITRRVVTEEGPSSLTQANINSAVEDVLERHSIQDPTAIAAPKDAGKKGKGESEGPPDPEKLRKALPAEAIDRSLEADLSRALKHKEVLFKAHRTLSQEKNRTVDKMRNLMRELASTGLHRHRGKTVLHRLRHNIEDMLLRGSLSFVPQPTVMNPKRQGPEFQVSLLKGGYTSADTLFELFRSCCSQLEAGPHLFIICASSPRLPCQNKRSKRLSTAPTEHFVYAMLSLDPAYDEASVILLTSH